MEMRALQPHVVRDQAATWKSSKAKQTNTGVVLGFLPRDKQGKLRKALPQPGVSLSGSLGAAAEKRQTALKPGVRVTWLLRAMRFACRSLELSL